MIKARFSEAQKPVCVLEKAGKTHIFICLNERQAEEDKEDGSKETYYEYDYNEFSGTDLNVEDILAHPEAYLGYPEKAKTQEERIAELEEQNSILTQCLLEMSELVYQ